MSSDLFSTQQLENLVHSLNTDIVKRNQADQAIWFDQVAEDGKKNLIQYLMKKIISDAVGELKLAIIALYHIVSMVSDFPNTFSQRNACIKYLSSVENFWTFIYSVATATAGIQTNSIPAASASTTRCHSIALMLSANRLSQSNWPARVFSPEIISSVFEMIESHQSSSISLNMKNLQVSFEYLVYWYIEEPEKFQRALEKRQKTSKVLVTALLEICAQILVSEGHSLVGIDKSISQRFDRNVVQGIASLLLESPNVYTPLALMLI